MKQRFIAWIALVLMLSLKIVGAVTWYVHPDSTLNSIQAGLDSCTANDTVLVGPGVYYENIDWPYILGLSMISECGPDTTIIDGNYAGSVIHLSLMPEDSVTLIHGFTMRNGNAWLGGAVYSVGGRPTISGNVITGNTADWPRRRLDPDDKMVDHAVSSGGEPATREDGPPPQGGGIYTEWSSAVITDNVITGNSATTNGGGIACFCDAANISPLIQDNTITSNAAHAGGGVYIDCPFTMTVIKENMICMNTADYGGGIACYYVFQPLLTINKNMIIENTADSAGGGIWCYLASSPIIDSCIISGNIGDGIYSDYYSTPMIFHNNITNNLGFGVRNDDASHLVIAENNWWGHATGPYHPITNPGGQGDSVSDHVDYDPWMTSPGVRELVPLQPVGILLQVSPNPFSQNLKIRFTIQDSRFTIEKPQLCVYDVGGRLVKSFDPESCIMDRVSMIIWNGTDQNDRRLPEGIYLLRLQVGDYAVTEKTVLLR
jgi:parallel beta-helix repeat protein